MIVDAILIGAGAFGVAGFCFLVGVIVGATTGQEGATTFPVTHVSFDRTVTDEQRLAFLEKAAEAVRSGCLSQAKQLSDDSARDEEK
ncbi:hypothetical protein [Pseudomonas sp. TTU2014-080ASC]|uniref:hypothetical protein n=1 Tax=Pseudomonas sp. TTU2014-080ASC TaxID=1729724 RepID=UPI00071893AC|nr:hypothetical protein [Pseudomonas sp. TTU2014-080ASC]KRW62356.1 hypothetical protein AO726_02735 [Pseudomonas sp. TTU2014-080ASC]